MKNFIFIILLFCSYSNVFAQNTKGKTILLTAANGELGEAIAFSLASERHNLIISGRNASKIDNLRNNLKNAHQDILVKTAIIDFSNIATIEH